MAGICRGLLAAAFVVFVSAATFGQAKSLVLGTASLGGTYVVYGEVVASLLTGKAGLQVSTQQTQGPLQNVIMVDDRKLAIGMTTMGLALQAWTGSGAWTKGRKYENIRALFPMYDTPLQCVSLKKSGITAFRQLEGKVVGVGPKAGTPGTYFPLIFDALGMKAKMRNGQGDDMGNQLKDGLIDAFCFSAGVPVPVFSQLDADQQVVFYTWTSDDITTIRNAMMEFSESTIPKGAYRQQTADQKTVGLYNFAIVNKDMPDATAYLITRTVLENNALLVKGHAAAKETVAANAVRNNFLPFHPGAVRYYKEKGIKLDPATLAK